ncbi:MAG: glycosyltransferase [Flavobacteriales bacterium]|nr:glycosyltransferase [Flavobacteriales bacterium]MCB9166100.1 glycosyltransferase [Flavobacteriales bacterium]
MKKVLYIVSGVASSKEYEHLVAHWDRSRATLGFLLLNPQVDTPLARHLLAAGIPCRTIVHRGRKDLFRTFLEILREIGRQRPDVVHANLLEASFLGTLAARIRRVPAVIHTRHHSTHNFKYHPFRGVLYDKIIDRLSHRIIAISSGVVRVLVDMEHVPARKVVLIHHGFPLDGPRQVSAAAEKARAGYFPSEPVPYPIIAMVARPFAWKGLDHAIPAFGSIRERWPDARLLLFNWTSTPHSARYERMLSELPEGVHRTVAFDADLADHFQWFDLFIHVPEDDLAEAFGLVYAEGMIAGTPCVFTRSGLINDLNMDRSAGTRIVPHKNARAIADAALELLQGPLAPSMRAGNARRNIDLLRPVIGMEEKMRRLFRLYESGPPWT